MLITTWVQTTIEITHAKQAAKSGSVVSKMREESDGIRVGVGGTCSSGGGP